MPLPRMRISPLFLGSPGDAPFLPFELGEFLGRLVN